MGPVEAAIRERIRRGKELHTPARKTRFVVDRIDDRGVVWARRLSPTR